MNLAYPREVLLYHDCMCCPCIFIMLIAICDTPTDPANGVTTFFNIIISIGDAVAYTCNNGFEIAGSALAICTELSSTAAELQPGPPTCDRKSINLLFIILSEHRIGVEHAVLVTIVILP